MKYSVVSFASTSRRRTTEPMETTLVSMSLLVDHRAFASRSSSCAMLVLEHHLLVLRVVVLGVLGDLAELARGGDALRDLSPLVVRNPSSSLFNCS